MKIAILIAAVIAFNSAGAAVFTPSEPKAYFCISFERDNYVKPWDRTQAWPARPPAEQTRRLVGLATQMKQHLMNEGVFDRSFEPIAMDSKCGPHALTAYTTSSLIQHLSRKFAPLGARFVTLNDAPARMEPLPAATAAAIRQHAEAMRDLATMMLREIPTDVIENAMPGIFERYAEVMNAKYPVNGVPRSLERALPEFWGTMQKEMGLLEEHVRRHFLIGLTNDWNRALEDARKRNRAPGLQDTVVVAEAVSAMLAKDLDGFNSDMSFNFETFEVFGQSLLHTLDVMERYVDEFQIASAVNAQMALARWFFRRGENLKDGDRLFGDFYKRALTRMTAYGGLDPYVQLLIQALLANQVVGKSEKPTPDTVRLYHQVWREMPMMSHEEISLARTDVFDAYVDQGVERQYVRGPSRLFKRHGQMPSSVLIVEGMRFIEDWLRAHGFQVAKWSEQKGLTYQEALRRLNGSTVLPASDSLDLPCTGVLAEFLDKYKKKN